MPPGWHLPSDAEWQVLVDFAGGDKVAGNMLKSSSGWSNYNGKSGNGVDAIGFAALPGGYGYSDGNFSSVSSYCYCWSATKYDTYNACYRCMCYSYEGVRIGSYSKSGYFFNVRCVKD